MKSQNKRNKTANRKNIAIVSTILDSWGGSEELWALSIPYLQKENLNITVLRRNLNLNHKKIVTLKNRDVDFINLNGQYNKTTRRLTDIYYKLLKPTQEIYFTVFEKYLKTKKPSLVIISQGINFDGLMYGKLCLKYGIDYVIVSQKAVEFFWPPKNERDYMTEVFKKARKCFFVSGHNQNLTEEKFGFRFKNAEIIYNPNKLKIAPLKYPSTKAGFKLALIGRLFVIDKGQDILFRILAKDTWKKRKLQVSLIGSGPDSDGLKALANLLHLDNVVFLGFQDNIEDVWLNHHALVLPSRSEGMPLVVLEAMAAGRTVIATRAGGTTEFVEDNITGFIGDATEKSFEETLEKAWNEREHWQAMGLKASKFIEKKIVINSEIDFANQITSLVHG